MPVNILLLTNRDSDNTGDQVIEACDIALIRTVMKNLGISKVHYDISSRAASIIPQKYLDTRDPEMLEEIENKIAQVDIIIFGGAPIFNYLYQTFYERTTLTVEIAQKYHKPVIFSAIGIERYDEKNKKCQRVKQAVNLDCVKQITTRDGYEFLEKFRENPNIKIAKVSDPAVFASKVFENYKFRKWKKNKLVKMYESMKWGYGLYHTKQITFQEGMAYLWEKGSQKLGKKEPQPEVKEIRLIQERDTSAPTHTGKDIKPAPTHIGKDIKPAPTHPEQDIKPAPVKNTAVSVEPKQLDKKIGIFVFRANGFTDNKIKFNREQAAELWVNIVKDLEKKGYNYDLLTNGHFGDEAFMDSLIRDYGIRENKCVFNINDPETLISKLSSYDGIITCRLHPSIIAFSFKIPAVSLVWNSKIEGFYKSIGYEDRMIYTDGITSGLVIERLEKAMKEGVVHDKEYLVSVYQTLFDALKAILKPDDTSIKAYTYDELMENIIPFSQTSEAEKKEKLKRKFRRTYQKYNKVSKELRELKEMERNQQH